MKASSGELKPSEECKSVSGALGHRRTESGIATQKMKSVLMRLIERSYLVTMQGLAMVMLLVQF